MKELNVYHSYGVIEDREVKSFESRANIILPDSYYHFLIKNNAPSIEESAFDFYNFFSEEKDSRDISFYGYGDEIPSYDRITRVLNLSEYGHDKIIIFGRSANGDYICFDYRHDPKTNNPKVVLMFHDEYGDDNKMLVCPLADSFEEFVDMLYEYKDE